jgi:hypothetical protein
VPGIVAGQLGFAAVNPFYKKSPPRQGAIVQCGSSGGAGSGRGERVVGKQRRV